MNQIIPILIIVLGVLLSFFTIKFVPQHWLKTGLFEPSPEIGKTYIVLFIMVFAVALAFEFDMNNGIIAAKLVAFQYLVVPFNLLIIERAVYLLWVRNSQTAYPFKLVITGYFIVLIFGLSYRI